MHSATEIDTLMPVRHWYQNLQRFTERLIFITLLVVGNVTSTLSSSTTLVITPIVPLQMLCSNSLFTNEGVYSVWYFMGTNNVGVLIITGVHSEHFVVDFHLFLFFYMAHSHPNHRTWSTGWLDEHGWRQDRRHNRLLSGFNNK